MNVSIRPNPETSLSLDLWYMDQFARMIALQALAENREQAQALCKKLEVSPLYFLQTGSNEFPPRKEVLDGFEPLRTRLNAAAHPKSDEWKGLLALLTTP